LRCVEEFDEEPEGQKEREGHECADEVPHPRGAGRMAGMEIELESVIKRENDEQKEAASEPGEMGVEEFDGFGAVLRPEPIFFIWQIDEFRRQDGQERGNGEAHDAGENADNDDGDKECRLRLPSIDVAAAIEVRSDNFRQLRVRVGKVESSVNS